MVSAAPGTVALRGGVLSAPPNITRILRELRDGDGNAVNALLPLVYDELHRIAGRAMRRERSDHTLQPTALVHEAYVRLVKGDGVEWQDRAHFLGVAAHVMRQVLVDHARKTNALRRGGDAQRVTFSEGGLGNTDHGLGLLDLHHAMERFATVDERAAQVAEMRLFGGATIPEIAEALGVSKRTVDMDWAAARMWLSRELKG